MKFEPGYYSHCLLTFAFVSMAVQVCFAQIEFTEHAIAGDFNGANSVYATDIDGDGDMDMLGAAFEADDITWWENDGEQDFTEHTITGNFNGAASVYAADIDDDGDMDVLGAAYEADDITWWENNGEQDFTEHTIATDFDGATSVYAVDIDDDGDMDVLGAASDADDITWWENDGEQDFTEHTIAGNFDGAFSVYTADINGDGDIDVLGAAYCADDITWWENDGEQNFNEHTIVSNFLDARCVYAVDVDNDGDMDVLGAASQASDITWWENDGEQDFTEHTIPDDYFDGAWSVYATDIDGDGDIDVLGAARVADDITWWESDLDPTVRWLALPDTSFVEDGSLQLSPEYLYDHIFSPDFDNEDLVISVEDGEHILGELSDEGLTITADQDWNGIDSLMLIVTDPDENSDSTYQHIMVAPVNDLPSEFELLTPEDAAYIHGHDTLDFTWESSTDPDEDAEVHYYLMVLVIYHPDYPDTTRYDSNTDNTFRLDDGNKPETWYYGGDFLPLVEWWVQAVSGEDTTNSTSKFSLDIAASVEDEHCTVKEFALSNPFPNPFNSTTTIDYSLPVAGAVSLAVYNLSGREVARIADGVVMPAGQHEAVWAADGMSSGVYVVKLVASDQMFTRKVMLIR